MQDRDQQCIAKINQVSKIYIKSNVLEDINIKLNSGEVLAILGPNGAGKTTLVNSILGQLAISSGDINLFGYPPGSILVKRNTGAMLQVSGLPDLSTIKEHIQLFQSYYAQPMPYEQVMAYSGLKNIENQYSKTLSGGQKQRLLFALAICGNPKLLLLDEPSVGMDISARKSLWQAIESLKSAGTSVLMTTHYLEEADQLADRIIMLNNGKIVSQGTPKAIKAKIKTKTMRFHSLVNISEFSAINGISEISLQSGRENYYEIKCSSSVSILAEIFNKQLPINDLTITGAGLEQAFDLLLGNHLAS